MNQNFKTNESSTTFKCIYHSNHTRNIICNCGMKLCIICSSEHFHNNIFLQNESEYIKNFKIEVDDLLSLINKYEEKTHLENTASNCNANSKQIDFQSMKGLKEKISKFYKELKIESIHSYYKQNFKEKILNSILLHYKKKTNSKLNLVSKIASDYVANHKNMSNENSLIEFSLTNSNIKDEFIINKNSSSSPFLSNKENLSPSVNSKRILNKHIMITNFTTKFNEELFSKNISQGGDLSSFNIQPNFFQNQINRMKTNDGLKIIYPLKKENIMFNFNIGNNNEFLGSGESKSDDCVKMVCITCRERFTVLKDQLLWKRRCELCSSNYTFN